SILVPLPPAIGSSPQEANAAIFGRKQAAEVIRDADLKREILVERVKSTITSSTLLQSMAEAIGTFAEPDATQKIVAEVLHLANRKIKKAHEHKREGVSI